MKSLFSVLVLVLCSFFAFAALPIDVNRADAQLLADSLNGIGLKKAEAIVAWREKNGEFSNIEQMLAVKGIGESFIVKNKDRVVFQ